MTGTVEEIIRQVDGQIQIQWGEEKRTDWGLKCTTAS